VAPVYYLEMAKAASCHPQYLGIGLSTIDQVASTGCAANRSTEGAQFFNPSPAWQDRNRFDPSYEKAITAARRAEGGDVPDDDIVWLEWGLMKDVGQLLQATGKDPTRQGFVFAAERAQARTGVYPPLEFSPGDHFGAREVNVIENVCKQRGNDSGYYVTKYAFKGSF
jgi:branched-chain amino acid transport system substrate-binding protein